MGRQGAIKILVTGGAGYLGSVLVGHLLSRGHAVTVVDNLRCGQGTLLHYCIDPSFEFIYGDARDEALIKGLVASHDVFIPLAAVVGVPACDRDPISARTTNYDAVALLNRYRSREQRLVFPCTNSGYGTKSGDLYCTEETPLEPISLYGITKVEAEKLLLDSPNTVTFRLATVFGVSPRMRLDLLVNDFAYRAVHDRCLVLYQSDFKRNFVHIHDVADAFCFAIDNFERLSGEPYNLGLDSANLSKAELAERIKPFVPGLQIYQSNNGSDPDKRNYIVSNEKLRRKGFEAQRSLEEGLAQLMRAFSMLPRSALVNA